MAVPNNSMKKIKKGIFMISVEMVVALVSSTHTVSQGNGNVLILLVFSTTVIFVTGLVYTVIGLTRV
jgi:hypothetical protein